MPDKRLQNCKAKVRYNTRGDARHARNVIKKRGGPRYEIYPCDERGTRHYHLTSDRSEMTLADGTTHDENWIYIHLPLWHTGGPTPLDKGMYRFKVSGRNVKLQVPAKVIKDLIEIDDTAYFWCSTPFVKHLGLEQYVAPISRTI